MTGKNNTIIYAILGLLLAATLIGLGVDRWGWFATPGQPETDQTANTNVPAQPEELSIKLFYYNPQFDQTEGCDTNAVLPVQRQIPISQTPIQDAIKLLIQGQLQESEQQAGFTTEFPNPNFELVGADLKDGLLTLEFTEVPGFTSGGSCRIRLITDQITKTALQFPNVREVKFLPEEIFQP